MSKPQSLLQETFYGTTSTMARALMVASAQCLELCRRSSMHHPGDLPACLSDARACAWRNTRTHAATHMIDAHPQNARRICQVPIVNDSRTQHESHEGDSPPIRVEVRDNGQQYVSSACVVVVLSQTHRQTNDHNRHTHTHRATHNKTRRAQRFSTTATCLHSPPARERVNQPTSQAKERTNQPNQPTDRQQQRTLAGMASV